MKYTNDALKMNKMTMIESDFEFEPPKKFSQSMGFTVPVKHCHKEKTMEKSIIFAPFDSSFRFPFRQYQGKTKTRFQGVVDITVHTDFIAQATAYFERMFTKFMASTQRADIVPGAIADVEHKFKFENPLAPNREDYNMVFLNSPFKTANGPVPSVLVVSPSMKRVEYSASMFDEEKADRPFGFTFACTWLSVQGTQDTLGTVTYIVRPRCEMQVLMLQNRSDTGGADVTAVKLESRMDQLEYVMAGGKRGRDTDEEDFETPKPKSPKRNDYEDIYC